MSPADAEAEDGVLEQEFDLDAPPAKVWRALSIGQLRERWLPAGALAEPEPCAATPGREVSYRMRDEAPPFLESVVTFRVDPNGEGGTRLRIVHALTDARARPAAATRHAANRNGPLMLAA